MLLQKQTIVITQKILVVSLLFVYSVALNFFHFIQSDDAEGILRFTQFLAAVALIVRVAYEISPRFKEWLNKVLK